MNEEDVHIAMGEALYASRLAEMTFAKAFRGDDGGAIEAIIFMQTRLEEFRGGSPASERAVDHALERLERLRSTFETS